MLKQTLTFCHNDMKRYDGNNCSLTFLKKSNILNYEFYELLIENNVFGVLAIGIEGMHAEIHLEINLFNKKVYKQMDNIFKYIKSVLKEKGITEIYAPKYTDHKPKKKDKWDKFINHFGFNDTQKIYIARMAI